MCAATLIEQTRAVLASFQSGVNKSWDKKATDLWPAAKYSQDVWAGMHEYCCRSDVLCDPVTCFENFEMSTGKPLVILHAHMIHLALHQPAGDGRACWKHRCSSQMSACMRGQIRGLSTPTNAGQGQWQALCSEETSLDWNQQEAQGALQLWRPSPKALFKLF